MTIIDSDKKTIYTNRGDKLEFDFSIPITNDDNSDTESFYKFAPGDKISFAIYKKGKLNKPALLIKNFTVTEECTKYKIEISSDEMKIDKMYNMAVDYWYEITLNNDTTVVGYDSDGAKIIWLWPEGVTVEV